MARCGFALWGMAGKARFCGVRYVEARFCAVRQGRRVMVGLCEDVFGGVRQARPVKDWHGEVV